MKVLIGCEESQVLCATFRKGGHEAYSCDIEPTRGNTKWHYQYDVLDLINNIGSQFDLIILHPPCDAMAVCGNRWYALGKPGFSERIAAIDWTIKLWKLAKLRCERVALENPASVIFKYLNAPVQYIQPWMFGHGETKKPGLPYIIYHH